MRAFPVLVGLGAPLAPLAQTTEARELERRVGADIDALLNRLGLDGRAAVAVKPVLSTRPLRVRVRAAPQPYSPNLMLRAWLAVAPPNLVGLPTAAADDCVGFPAGWLARYAKEVEAMPRSEWSLVTAFVERLALQTIMKHPSCLLDDPQLERYAGRVDAPIEEVKIVLPELLELGVSVADTELVRELLLEGRGIRRSLEDTVEAIFIEVRSHRVEIHVHPETLRTLLPGSPNAPFSVYAPVVGERKEQFEKLEETFFATFGFRLPRLEWVPSPGLPPESVAIRIDAWWSLPLPMLPRGERLVNAPPEVLRDFGARVGVHPMSGAPCALVDDRFKDVLEEAQIETWGPVDFVSLNVLAELSRRPGRLLGIEDVEYQLAQLQDMGFDELVDIALAKYTLGDLTRVFRALLDERISLRDLRGILERLVQFETVESPSDEFDVLDERLPVEASNDGHAGWQAYYAYVRRQLRGYLSHKYTWHENTIVGYTLDPRLESRVRDLREPLSEQQVETVRDAIWTELQSLPPSPSGQIVVTSPAARHAVRQLLAPELPDLPIVARSELRADVNVQPIASIALP
jgi:hypothetical protein